MSFLVRIAFFAVILASFSGDVVYASGPNPAVPITVEDDFGGVIPGVRERGTCDPKFWDVLTNRAWEEGQREITQNQNLIARPDSVLSMTCFDSFLNHLGRYADHNFPSDPDETGGFASDLILSSSRDAGDLSLVTFGLPPIAWQGLNLYQTLQLLVLDQLMDASDAGTQAADDANYFAWFAACGSKEHFIDENFPDLMIGNRAITETGSPAWSSIGANLSTSVSRSNYNGCARMNEVWTRSKCYDFATDSKMYKDILPSPPVETPPGGEHDGFYSLQQYRDNAAAGNDYRTKASQCQEPQSDGKPDDIPSSFGEIMCLGLTHGLPGAITPSTLLALFLSNDVPTWTSAHAAANPDVTSSDAVADAYETFLGMRDTSSCPDPIKTGYIVTGGNGNQYVDAVCPAPGCYFNPPTTITGNGSCN